jgi:hypothetical protein
MISKIFGKKKNEKDGDKDIAELEQKISKMNLTDLRLYVRGKLDVELNEEGLILVLEKLISKINDKRYYLDSSDDDSKLKKAFDIVISIAKSKKVTVKAVELISEFIQTYEKLIKEYDKRNKDIYHDRLMKSVDVATEIIELKVALENKMNILEQK